MFLGILAYCLLLLLYGWKIPGSLRRNKKENKDRSKHKVWIVVGFIVVLVAFIVLGFAFIQFFIATEVAEGGWVEI